MKYDKFLKKAKKRQKILNWLFKFRWPLLSAAGVVSASGITLMGLCGVITENTIPDSIMYGETLEGTCDAIFTSPSYQYRKEGSDEWTDEIPTCPGVYYVRVKTNRIFGITTYSDEQKVVINKMSTVAVIEDDSWEYGSTPKINITLHPNDKVESVSYNYSDIKDMKVDITPELDSIVITNRDGEDVTSYYEIETVTKSLDVKKRSISIESGSFSGVYDGTSHECKEYSIVSGNLAFSDAISVTKAPSITYKDKINNDLEYQIFNSNGIDVTSCYNIINISGSLEILPKEISIESGSSSKAYDGSELYNQEYEYDSENWLISGDSLIVLDYTKVLDYTENPVNNILAIKIENEKGVDVTSSYVVVQKYGSLEITKRSITIKSSSSEKEYDGTALVDTGYDVISEVKLCDGDSISVINNASILDYQEDGVDNVLEFKVFRDNIDITDNYDITQKYGTLSITKRNISIVTGTSSHTYDGLDYQDNSYYISSDKKIISNETIAIENVSSVKYVSDEEIDNIIYFKIFRDELDITKNYEISVSYGTIKILPKHITVTTSSAEIVYNGEFNSLPNYSVDALVDGNFTKIITEELPKGKNVPLSGIGVENAFEIAIYSDEEMQNNISSSYAIDYDYGTILITKRPIEITTSTDSKEYDATPLSNDGYEISSETKLCANHTIEIISSIPSITYVKDSGTENQFAISILCDEEDVTYNYDITYKWGTLSISQRKIEITTGSSSKVYDGKTLSCDDFSVTNGSIAGTDFAKVIGELTYITYVKESNKNNNILSIKIFNGDTDVTDNYSISIEYGDLSITKREIEVTTQSDSKTYDGKELYNSGFIISKGELADDENASADVSQLAKITHVDESDANNIFNIIIKHGDIDVTENYSIDYIYGKLEIFKKEVKLTTPSKEDFLFDGLEHYFIDGISIPEIVEGDIWTVATYAKIRNVGTLTNEVTIKVTNGNGRNTTDDYDWTDVSGFGTLGVVQRQITVITGDSKVYDGYYLFSKAALDIVNSPNSLVYGHEFDIPEPNKIVNVKDSLEQDIVDVKIYSYWGGSRFDETNNYEISYTRNPLQITKRAISVETGTDEFTYDGEKHTCKEVKFISNSLAVTDSLDYDKITYPYVTYVDDGLVSNIYDLKIKRYEEGKYYDSTANYEINYTSYGKIKIIPRNVELTTLDEEFEYDGEYHTATKTPTFSNDSIVQSDHIVIYEKFTKVKYVDDNTENNNMLSVKVFTADEKEVTNCYKITATHWGTIKIIPRKVEITTENEQQEYDGNSHESITSPTFDNKPLVSTDTIEVIERISLKYVDDNSSNNNVMKVKFYENNEGHRDVTNCYEITATHCGTFEITPRKVEITTENEEFEYDGNSHESTTSPTFDNKPLVSTDTFEVIERVTIKYVDDNSSNNNVMKVKFYENTTEKRDVTNCYELVERWGTIKITPRDTEITTGDEEYAYDGNIHISITIPTFDNKPLLSTDTFEVISRTELKYATGSVNNNIVEVKFYENNEGHRDVTNCYNIADTHWGTIKIIPIKIEVTTEDESFKYDGQPHTSKTMPVISSGSLLENDKFEVYSRNTVTSALDCYPGNNIIEIIILNGDNRDVTNCYDITYKFGDLTIYDDPSSGGSGSGSGSGESGGESGGSGSGGTGGSGSGGGSGEFGGESGGSGSGGTGGSGSGGGSGESGGESGGSGSGGTGGSGSGSGSGESGGESGGSGSGGTGGTNTTGNISNKPSGSSGEGQGQAIFSFVSDTSGQMYFKIKSYGDYVLSGFEEATCYDGTIIPNFMIANIFKRLNIEDSYTVKIIPNGEMSIIIPYYITEDNIIDNMSDVFIDKEVSGEYTIYYIDYDYLLSECLIDGFAISEVSEYDEFVHNHYLQLPDTTRASMLEIASENGLSASSKTIINDVKTFIQNVKPYNLDFTPFPDGCDVAVYFLTDAVDGICQHYAASATCMYRALGIPARYTVGFTSNSVAGQKIEVGAKQAHAWVEIYLDGIGWIQIEVTGQGQGGSASSGSGGSNPIIVKPTINVKPKDIVANPNGSPICPNAIESKELDALLLKGFTYHATYYGSLTTVGQTISKVETFHIFDPNGNDVTDNYNIKKSYGKIIVTDKKIVNFYVFDYEKEYDGIEYVFTQSDVYYDGIPDDYSVSYNISGSLTSIGTVKSVISELRIFDSSKNDVTDEYYLNMILGSITINKISLTVQPKNISKVDDGSQIESNEVVITVGNLLEGHTLVYDGLIISNAPGKKEVQIDISKLHVYDSEANDVTNLYNFNCIAGVFEIIQSQ